MSYNHVPVSQIPEVDAYEKAKANLNAFKQANPRFFDALERLVDEYNTTMEAAEKAVRAKQASCGDFDYYQRVVKYDAKALHDAVGRETFIEIGGTIKMEAVYKIDGKRLQLALAQNLVDKDLVDEITKEEARYHMPKPASIP